MGTRINADGSGGPVAPAQGRAFSLTELQAIVGGYIEAFYLRDGTIMFLNEDGKRLDLPFNFLATRIARERGFLPLEDYIVGDVVLTDRTEAGVPTDDDDEAPR